ncbi:hypothetical protein F4Y93_14390 [Candidatus Poribacteria bacterium]|nr:hypothetical protein [Candidatus Poribacteria bacterium]
MSQNTLLRCLEHLVELGSPGWAVSPEAGGYPEWDPRGPYRSSPTVTKGQHGWNRLAACSSVLTTPHITASCEQPGTASRARLLDIASMLLSRHADHSLL